jgi:hypothetical protein
MSISELRTFRIYTWRGLDPRPIMAFLAVAACIVGNLAGVLMPLSDDIDTFRDYLCKGPVDIIMAEDSLGLAYIVKSQPIANAATADRKIKDSYVYKAVWQAINFDGIAEVALGEQVSATNTATGYETTESSLTGSAISLSGGPWSLDAMAWRSARETAGRLNDACQDIFSKEVHKAYPAFREVLSQNVPGTINDDAGCGELAEYCSYDTTIGIQMRSLCPVTCKCDTPSPLPVPGGENNGCPLSCRYTKNYQDALNYPGVCEDYEKSNAFWAEYLTGIQQLRDSVPSTMHLHFDDYKKAVKELGCGVIDVPIRLPQGPGETSTRPWFDLCQGDEHWYLTPLSHICPKACKCHVEFKPMCPNSCVVSPVLPEDARNPQATSLLRASQNVDL